MSSSRIDSELCKLSERVLSVLREDPLPPSPAITFIYPSSPFRFLRFLRLRVCSGLADTKFGGVEGTDGRFSCADGVLGISCIAGKTTDPLALSDASCGKEGPFPLFPGDAEIPRARIP